MPLGFAPIAAGALGGAEPAVTAHVFDIRAVAGMTLAVMMRATMGHTGRPQVAGRALSLAFAMICAAMLARVAGQEFRIENLDRIDL